MPAINIMNHIVNRVGSGCTETINTVFPLVTKYVHMVEKSHLRKRWSLKGVWREFEESFEGVLREF